MNFRSISAFDDMSIGNDAIGVNKETATTRKFLTTRVKRFNCHCGGLNPADEFGKQVLGERR
jgi:hypothetical protein